MELYADHHPKTSIKGFGYANAEKARETLKKLDWKSRVKKNNKEDEIKKKVDENPNYVIQVVITMYHRAKHHPHRTKGMEEAMEVFQEYLDKYNVDKKQKQKQKQGNKGDKSDKGDKSRKDTKTKK